MPADREALPRLSTAQRDLLEAVGRGDVRWHPGFGRGVTPYYSRADARPRVRQQTMSILLNRGLVVRPSREMGHYMPIGVEITPAGQEALDA